MKSLLYLLHLFFKLHLFRFFNLLLIFFRNPTPIDNDPLLQITWDPVADNKTLNYLSIGSELTKGRNPFLERMLFWEKLHDDHLFLRTLVYFNDIGVSW